MYFNGNYQSWLYNMVTWTFWYNFWIGIFNLRCAMGFGINSLWFMFKTFTRFIMWERWDKKRIKGQKGLFWKNLSSRRWYCKRVKYKWEDPVKCPRQLGITERDN